MSLKDKTMIYDVPYYGHSARPHIDIPLDPVVAPSSTIELTKPPCIMTRALAAATNRMDICEYPENMITFLEHS